MTTGTPPRNPSTGARRSRLRRYLPLAVAAWMVLEIWLLTVVAGAIGGFALGILLVAGIVLGSVVMKSAGRRAFQNLTETLQRQQSGSPEASKPPEQRSQGNGLLMLAGLLLMIPGLISDVLGLLLLVPPLRTALSRYTERKVERKMGAAAGPGSFGDAFQKARMRQSGSTVIQGEVVKDDERPGSRGDDADPRPPLTP
ncbi:FxsA family protein [Streptomyces sp. NBC_00006]|uniref:FxsA family membrane protein n=1 Tax=Streptomyces sp. NBC_00006 TaxID=2975619 RepID=UPI00225BC09A|nr:FxsA family membrane protein [Streptomyces sp. NBC_00006]MCX5534854.1 FxsA family protein [Streptomyces sp. NBC_00006]